MKLKRMLLLGFFVSAGGLIMLVSYFISQKDQPSTIKASWLQCSCIEGKLQGETCLPIARGLRCSQ